MFITVRPIRNSLGLAVKGWLLVLAGLATGSALAQGPQAPTTEQQAGGYIGGTAPDHRRDDVAPIRQAPALDRKAAFAGVAQPYPATLGVFKDQGAWYTPFTHAGMSGPYDIRGWHRD